MKRFMLSLMLSALAAAPVMAAQTARPDLQGLWTNDSLTTLERPPALGSQRVYTSAQTDDIEMRAPRGEPFGGFFGRLEDQTGTGAAHHIMRVGGEPRTSFITSTADGRVPQPINPSAPRPALAQRTPTENPEQRSLAERCIMPFGNVSGPVMLPSLYNSNYEIVQTADTVAIATEMVHDVRIVRLNTRHRSDGVRPWMGDSIGRYEDGALVVETTNFPRAQAFRGAWEKLKITERFTRISADRILYRFTVEDPTVWAKPWGGEYEFGKASGPLYEYACHEGNYTLEGELAGARADDAKALKR
jgi:hypothetical protein